MSKRSVGKIGKLVLCVLTVFVTTWGIALAITIPHTHETVGHTIQLTPIPETGKWRCKVWAPQDGQIWCAFEYAYHLRGYAIARNGQTACGRREDVSTEFTFKSVADINVQGQQAAAKAWANEPAEPTCPAETPN